MLKTIRVFEAARELLAATMDLGGVLAAWAPLSPAVLWTAQMLLVASSETLQCEGPASTRDSSCHTGALEDPREKDFQVKGYTFSAPFHLVVAYDWLILQSPAMPVFEGDPLVLRCQAWQDWPLTQVTFYRDGSPLCPPGPHWEFSIAAVREADSGQYHCSAVFRSLGPGNPETAASVAVTVQELFPVPVLRATPSAEAQEGDAVTLICQTKLPPQRSATHLLFSFHKDGQTVRGRSLSPELQIPVASAAHAGSYWCEATTEDSQVWKQSPRLEVRVQGPPSSAAPPALSPAPQESAAPGTTATDPSEPPPASPPPSSEGPGQSCPLQALDPHLHHQMGLLLKQMQDVTALLGHLVVELRDLSGRLKLETSKGRAKYE
ncbi:Fc receptor like A [Rhinolophus ferrumequinum]|uniref:Fc receptor like A n=1 Tax=Rhinolophus ferrumequinum TaxID=59479 RepID=A0A7J7SWR1_RHIFE|nr:Fc receptor like A [Rhinolophus ferrumequinum]